jgi:ATP-dependent RNA helicase DOB1
MADLITRIKDGEDVELYLQSILNRLHNNGPADYGDLEVLSYIKLYQPDLFSEYEKTVLNLMGLYFKQGLSEETDIRAIVSNIFGQGISKKYGHSYTPVQANLIDNMTDNRLFSFSSATSTGKSHVFRDLILKQDGDMVIVVPSRALINEYFTRTLRIVEGQKVNVLVFPDIVNTDMAERSVFILTPERVKDLFKIKDKLNLRTVLFDEAQMADDEGRRGIYFDSIVRRVNEHFNDATMLFAQPYIDNPGAQFARNHLTTDSDIVDTNSKAYPYRNVGQVFTCVDTNGKYHHFAIDKTRLGNRKTALDYDPIKKCLSGNGSVLVYVSKASIYSGEALKEMAKYTRELELIQDENALKIINRIGDLLGGSANEESPDHSDLLSLLNQGIVIHHGSLPLQARFLIEEFINQGFCRICFATSTLYQGINMPFDIVYLKRLEESKPLLVKNLIGRAGRSTSAPVFDFGQVIVSYSGMSIIRNVLAGHNIMSEVSQIDIDDEGDDVDLSEFKDAIKKGELNDFYNLTTPQIDRLGSTETSTSVKDIVEILLSGDSPIDEVHSSLNDNTRNRVVDAFKNIFKQHVKSRDLSSGEAAVIENAVQIFMSQIKGRNLKSIIGARFAYIAQTRQRKNLESLRSVDPSLYAHYIEEMKPGFTMPAEDIPNKDLPVRGLFPLGTKIYEAGYDRVMYDTYDYIDKVWGFCLSDIFFAAFDIYYKTTSDVRAQTMCKYIRYATIDDVEIWLLRYGFSFEDIEWIKPLIHGISEKRIEFKDVSNLSAEQMDIVRRYIAEP